MQESDLRVGDWYVVAGEGPMKLVEVPAPPVTLSYTFETDYGHLWHATLSQIVGLVDIEFVEAWEPGYRRTFRGRDYEEGRRTWLAELRQWAKERSRWKK